MITGSGFIDRTVLLSETRGRAARLRTDYLNISLTGRFPDGDVRVALGGERLALPAGPTLLELHAGELGHQVELGRPDVAERDRAKLNRTAR
jgi:hypothetical protein